MLKKLILCMALVLMTGMCLPACHSADGGKETDPADGTSASVDTNRESNPIGTDPADTDARDTSVADTDAPDTDAPDTAESETTPEGPVYEPTALPAANVAREGYAVASTNKWNTPWNTKTPLYSNRFINDGDKATVYASEWGPKNPYGQPFDPNADNYFFIDLTRPYKVESVRLFPAADYEGGFPEAVDVLISNDGKTYTKVTSAEGMSAAAAANGYTIELGGVDCKYVKVSVTKVGPGDAERGKFIALGEVEVMAPIDTASNMILNLPGLWLFKDPDTSHQIQVSYYRDGTPVDSATKLTYEVADPSVALVSEDGVVTPVAFGKTEVYVSDGKNRTTLPVEVRPDIGSDGFLISGYHVTTYSQPHVMEESLDLLIRSGVEHIESTHAYDLVGNNVDDYTLYLCASRGAVYTLWEDVVGKSEEQIQEIIDSHAGRPGFAGLFITDEPSGNYTDCARALRILNKCNPHYFHYLNLLPPVGAAGQGEYYNEFCAVGGYEGRNTCLSYDHYPFSTGGFDRGVYASLESIRSAGLQYNFDTAWYMQSQIMPPLDGIYGGTRRYNVSLGLAYGAKNFKHYLTLCPFDYMTGASDYDAGILDRDYRPAPYYDEVVVNNRYLENAGKLLRNTDAIEVYHTNHETAAVTLPEDFIFGHASGGSCIYTLYETWDGTRQYVGITNKRYDTHLPNIVRVKVQGDVSGLSYYDPMTAETNDLYIDDEGCFTLVLEPGSTVIVLLPEGTDAARPVEPSANLALGKGAYVSSSQSDFHTASGIGSQYLTDGNPAQYGWLSAVSDQEPYIILDLGEVQKISRVLLYENSRIGERSYLTNFTLAVSTDGVTYTDVLTVKDASYADLNKAYECIFDATDARFVRIIPNGKTPVGLAEMEVYA